MFQAEVGEETNTPHFQGYVEWKQKKTFTAAKALLGGDKVHLEARRGTQQQAIDYCSKEDTRVDGPWYHGTPKKQPKVYPYLYNGQMMFINLATYMVLTDTD